MSKAIKEKITIMPEPDRAEGKLKVLGGSKIDDFNNVLANDVIRSLWYGSDDAMVITAHNGHTLNHCKC